LPLGGQQFTAVNGLFLKSPALPVAFDLTAKAKKEGKTYV
jgi:hypothetical protein